MELTRKDFSKSEGNEELIDMIYKRIEEIFLGNDKGRHTILPIVNKVVKKTAQLIKDSFKQQGEYTIKLGEEHGRPISIKEKSGGIIGLI